MGVKHRKLQEANLPKTQWGAPDEQTVDLAAGTQEILASNDNRVGALIVNDGVQDIYLAIGHPAEVNKGIFLSSGGGFYEVNYTNPTTQAINGIAVADGGHVTKQEAE